MKRFAYLLVMVAAMSLASCGGNSNKAAEAATEEVEATVETVEEVVSEVVDTTAVAAPEEVVAE